jgi:uncharacterized protein (TIGR00297 family)
MYLSILLPSILALFALWKRKLTLSAIVLAWVIGVVVTYFGGYYVFTALAIAFILTIVSDKLKKSNKDDTRNIYQIISNVLTSALCIVLFAITDNHLFFKMFFAVVACSLGDTLSSSIGIFSRKKPINMFTFERIEKGASGGISALGCVAALLAGAIIGVIYLIYDFDLVAFSFITLFGLVGSLLDSVMGLVLQSQYRCVKCKKVVEVKKHCRHKTKQIRGFAFVDNNIVNLLSNVIVLILSYIFMT